MFLKKWEPAGIALLDTAVKLTQEKEGLNQLKTKLRLNYCKSCNSIEKALPSHKAS